MDLHKNPELFKEIIQDIVVSKIQLGGSCKKISM